MSCPSPNASLWSLRLCGNGAALPRIPLGRYSQSWCVCFLRACLCMSKRKTHISSLVQSRDFGSPPVCRRLRPGLGSTCFGTGPCFPITAAAVLGQLVSPALFRFLLFPKQHGSWLGLDFKENTSKTLKTVVVRNHSPVPSCVALPAFQTVLFERPAPTELSHSPRPQYF